MINGCKQFFERKAIHDFDAFFNEEFIDFFVSSTSFTVPEMIEKNFQKTRKKICPLSGHILIARFACKFERAWGARFNRRASRSVLFGPRA